ncbi:ABC transporter substrate-binding protein [Pusillimonas sp. NJUB218]|uniref:ABC transporter substrate-binding protein n=1 Tax=Pusillimonas sp. NJUB218 TaxID=2023230 RepID=UPI000F4C0E65|nr:ABC transporter substrate-binding protein [Pusillimonas sp. NJUB218]ROT46383.1 hypothetical protein CHR62_00110 [Pusillimonas sp. NJUB218]
MSKRLFSGLAKIGAAMALSASFAAQAADKVSIQLDYVVRGSHAMFFVANEKGFFKENNIEITKITRGSGSTDALRLVSNGNAQFGFADLPTLMVGRARNVPAVALAAVNQRSPLALIAVKEKRDLKSPSDLKGLNLGVHPSGSTYIFLKAFLSLNGMSLDDIKQSTVSPPYESFLLLGRVDAVPGYINAEVPELEAKAGGKGSLSILMGADYGYNAYGSGMFTSEEMIKNNPDLVQRFTKAYLKAFEYVINHPDEAVDIIIKANPEYSAKRDMLKNQLAADISTFFDTATKEQGIGIITPEQWKATAEILVAQEVLPKDASRTAGYDMTFQKAANPLRK